MSPLCRLYTKTYCIGTSSATLFITSTFTPKGEPPVARLFLWPKTKEHSMARPLRFPVMRGVRLTVMDARKLDALCTANQQPPSEILRWLIRTAEPTDGPAPVQFEIGEHVEQECALQST